MWTVAGVLLGFVVLATVLGFHVGPHSHLAAGVVGAVAAAWLLLMAATGHAEPLLWIAFGADVTLSAGVGTAAWKGLQAERVADGLRLRERISGAEGVAVSELNPDGVVKVRGESWSATSLNGRIPSGSKVQVVESGGVRLGVWGENAEEAPPAISLFQLEEVKPTGDEPEERRTGSS